MKEYVLRTELLTKTWHGTDALHEVSVGLEAGRIYGLIGRNGAGKSTLMRLIAGLVCPTSGKIELFGRSGEKELRLERKRMGCMIEAPGLNPNLTAKENIRMNRIMRGIPNKEVEDELLELVGLSDTAKKHVRNFSLGMKQRLGIAIALLGDPELLVLDEPVNGLDPLGVVDIRRMLRKLCEERQMTILISSHNLPELYQVATDYMIIHRGEVKQILTLEELNECCQHHLLIQCTEPEKLVCILETELHTSNYRVMPDKSVKLYDYLNEKERVARALFENGIIVTNFSKEGDTLEEYFISVVGRDAHV